METASSEHGDCGRGGGGAPRRRRSPRPRRLAYRGRCEGSCVHRSPPAEHGIGRPRCSTDGQPRSHDRHGARRHAERGDPCSCPRPNLGSCSSRGCPESRSSRSCLQRGSTPLQSHRQAWRPRLRGKARQRPAPLRMARPAARRICCQRIHQRPRRRWWRSQGSRRRMMPRARSWLAQNRFLVRDSLWSRRRRVRPRSWHAWWCSTGC